MTTESDKNMQDQLKVCYALPKSAFSSHPMSSIKKLSQFECSDIEKKLDREMNRENMITGVPTSSKSEEMPE